MTRIVFGMVFVLAVFGCGEEDDVEKPVAVLQGMTRTSDLSPLGVVEIGTVSVVNGGSVFESIGWSDSTGTYKVALGVEPLNPVTWRFQKSGFEPREFLIPQDATRVAENKYSLDVILAPI